MSCHASCRSGWGKRAANSAISPHQPPTTYCSDQPIPVNTERRPLLRLKVLGQWSLVYSGLWHQPGLLNGSYTLSLGVSCWGSGCLCLPCHRLTLHRGSQGNPRGFGGDPASRCPEESDSYVPASAWLVSVHSW